MWLTSQSAGQITVSHHTMYIHPLDKIHHIFYRAYFLFMNDNTFNMLLTFGISIEWVMMTNLPFAIDVSVVLVEFHKMDEPPYHKFIMFTIKENSPQQLRAITVVDRYVGNVSTELLQDGYILGDTGTPKLMYKPNTRPGPEIAHPINYSPMDPANSQSKHQSITPSDVAKGSVPLRSSSSAKMTVPFFLKNLF